VPIYRSGIRGEGGAWEYRSGIEAGARGENGEAMIWAERAKLLRRRYTVVVSAGPGTVEVGGEAGRGAKWGKGERASAGGAKLGGGWSRAQCGREG
jgi:hypothetical protein